MTHLPSVVMIDLNVPVIIGRNPRSWQVDEICPYLTTSSDKTSPLHSAHTPLITGSYQKNIVEFMRKLCYTALQEIHQMTYNVQCALKYRWCIGFLSGLGHRTRSHSPPITFCFRCPGYVHERYPNQWAEVAQVGRNSHGRR